MTLLSLLPMIATTTIVKSTLATSLDVNAEGGAKARHLLSVHRNLLCVCTSAEYVLPSSTATNRVETPTTAEWQGTFVLWQSMVCPVHYRGLR